MQLTTVLAPLAFIGLATAHVGNNTSASIVSALAIVNNATVDLGDAVTKWDGELLGTLPILAASTALLIDVKKGTIIAKESDPLDTAGALSVAGATNTLVASVNTTLTALIESKDKFDRLLLSPLIFGNLELQQKATSKMSDAIIDKLPDELEEVAENLVAPIDAGFEEAIDAYRPGF
ncbi:hydrophobic surface binding protein A-domain-containing protein [Chaetomium strumarium]|uniref:Hydrophobic surface binding protein A-domain-containing protein n=1 Tax=Chaetomium strumarium TaxID=1170767 RepID=A0AAJ0GWM7_9PEZI|nr:hydrophobic surface binding protein A-domain-containing protein [Chaetomium strumarium]